jgi:tetratricopeptide (TPR) repeat protein
MATTSFASAFQTTVAGALVTLLAIGSPGARAEEPTTAGEQARLCEERNGEEGLAACRSAIALGLGRERAAAVRQLLALRLASLERWDELAEVYREAVRLEPDDPAAHWRLGSTLLFALGKPGEALVPLQEAVRLAPAEPQPRLALGAALNALGRHAEAVAAFEEALRLDPAALDDHPGSRAVYEASQRGERWP